MMSEFNYGNPMEVPRLEKIVVNMGVGKAVSDGKKLQAAAGELAMITGQKLFQVPPASVDLYIPSVVAAQTVEGLRGFSFIACTPRC